MMKNKFTEPSVELLKFSCANAIEGSPDQIEDGKGNSSVVPFSDTDEIIGQ